MKTDQVAAIETAAEYHQRRAAQHRAMAELAEDIGVRKTHQQLADRHEALANGDKAALRIVGRD